MNIRIGLLAAALALPGTVCADIATRPEVAAFIKEVVARDRLDAAELEKLFRQVEIQPRIIEAMDRPAESKPWWQYRKILLSEAHVQGGVAFWRRNRAALDEAARRYAVAPAMVVAIIGAESRYGEVLGGFRVIDALATLGFDYPRRAEYFRKELEEFLLLCKEEGIDPLQPHGSYAGAMGMPQFMPSSYRRYAVDQDGDRKRNIWTNPADAIASVAHYFAHFGWRPGEPVAQAAKVTGDGFRNLLNRAAEVDYSLAEMRGLGVEPAKPLPPATRGSLLELQAEGGAEYWLTLHNFSVITRYNHSPLYAMATYQLSQEILARGGGQIASSPP